MSTYIYLAFEYVVLEMCAIKYGVSHQLLANTHHYYRLFTLCQVKIGASCIFIFLPIRWNNTSLSISVSDIKAGLIRASIFQLLGDQTRACEVISNALGCWNPDIAGTTAREESQLSRWCVQADVDIIQQNKRSPMPLLINNFVLCQAMQSGLTFESNRRGIELLEMALDIAVPESKTTDLKSSHWEVDDEDERSYVKLIADHLRVAREWQPGKSYGSNFLW